MPERPAERLIVVGGDAAGMSAATNARRLRGPEELEIVAFERGEWVSFSACGEPYYVAGVVDPLERLLARSPEQFARSHIQVHRWHEVTAIDTEQRTVTVRDLHAGEDLVVSYDYLMYGTGASASVPPVPGVDLAHVHPMHRLDDAQAVRRIVDEEGPERAVVVGGGYVGLEMAEAFRDRGIETTILTRSKGLLERTLDDDFSVMLAEQVAALGVRVITDRSVESLEGSDGRVSAVHCRDGRLPADVVIMATGVAPNVELAERAGIALGPTGAVSVDDCMRTSAPGVFAGGDCAESVNRVSGQPVNYHLGDIANKHGRVAGLNIGGADERFPGVLGTAITKFGEIEISRTGLTERDAIEAGLDAVSITLDSVTMGGYWPDSRPMRLKVTFERTAGRLLGAQIVGGSTAGKRIDTFATALWSEMTVHDLVHVDLAYAPPFSTVWDPVLAAARKAIGVLEGGE